MQPSVELKAEASETACEIEDEEIKAIQFEVRFSQLSKRKTQLLTLFF